MPLHQPVDERDVAGPGVGGRHPPSRRPGVELGPSLRVEEAGPAAPDVPLGGLLVEAVEVEQIVWSPLAQGILSGKYRPGEAAPSDSRAASGSMGAFIQRRLLPRTLSAVQALRPVAEGLGITLSQLAIAWVLRRPEVSSAIVGASRPEQVAENAAASGVVLDAETVARVEAIVEGAGLA